MPKQQGALIIQEKKTFVTRWKRGPKGDRSRYLDFLNVKISRFFFLIIASHFLNQTLCNLLMISFCLRQLVICGLMPIIAFLESKI